MDHKRFFKRLFIKSRDSQKVKGQKPANSNIQVYPQAKSNKQAGSCARRSDVQRYGKDNPENGNKRG